MAEDLGVARCAAIGRENAHGQDDAFADEPRHRRIRRLAIELRRRRELQHAAVDHHGDPVGERHRFRLVVGDVDHRRAGALVEVARTRAPLPRADARRDWRAARRGSTSDGSVTRQRASATRWRWPPERSAGAALGEAFELDQRERGVHALRPLGILHARHRQAVGDVLRDGHVRPQRVRLKHDPDMAPLRRDLLFGRGDDRIADQDASGVRPIEPRDLPQQRGLAAARWPEDGDEFAIGDRERHVVERLDRPVRLAEPFERQSRHGSTPLGRRPPSSSVASISVMLTITVRTPRAAA